MNTENAEDEIREAFKVFDGVSITNLLTVSIRNLLTVSVTHLLTAFYFYVLLYFVADKSICCLAMYNVQCKMYTYPNSTEFRNCYQNMTFFAPFQIFLRIKNLAFYALLMKIDVTF